MQAEGKNTHTPIFIMTHVQYGIYSHFEYFYHPSPIGQSKEAQADTHQFEECQT